MRRSVPRPGGPAGGAWPRRHDGRRSGGAMSSLPRRVPPEPCPVAGRLPALVALTAALVLAPCIAEGGPYTQILTDDGVWCWVSDPRALCFGSELVTGWVTRDGALEAGSLNLLTGSVMTGVLEEAWESDDHDHPAFLRLSDGRCAAFYCRHSSPGTYLSYRTTVRPEDVSDWGPLREVSTNTQGGAGATYAAVSRVPGATDQYYVFWRGGDWKPAMSVGTYDPVTTRFSWTEAERLISVFDGRPYCKFTECTSNRIGIAFTDGHPGENLNNVYYAEIRGEAGGPAFFRADGTRIKSVGSAPLVPAECDTVFDREQAPEEQGDNAWVWDVALGDSGVPVVAYVTFPTKSEHQYHWARFGGSGWSDATLVYDSGGSVADTTIVPQQHYYSGGLALDPRDPGICYLSRRNAWGGWDVDRWETTDAGEAWSVSHVALGTSAEHLRPVVPRDAPSGLDVVLMLCGRYDFFRNEPPEDPSVYHYDTSILAWKRWADSAVPDAHESIGCLVGVPNPFRDATTISFELPQPGSVDLCVYDVGGRRVRDLMRGERLTAGPHRVSWDGRDDGGRRVASGVYFVRADVGGRAQVRRVSLVR
ncbi:MAG: hypothetical protein GF405_03005 [Candidatus Eisenbacteria bacterium]|nr:hypothetical protein [Candidatus Eisenbacteria bacterium]